MGRIRSLLVCLPVLALAACSAAVSPSGDSVKRLDPEKVMNAVACGSALLANGLATYEQVQTAKSGEAKPEDYAKLGQAALGSTVPAVLQACAAFVGDASDTVQGLKDKAGNEIKK